MLPVNQNAVIDEGSEELIIPSRTFKLVREKDKIQGVTDEKEALKQAIYLILSTERYSHLIYSWNYGIELSDLFGKSYEEIALELPIRITEALMVDDRITAVSKFDVTKENKNVVATFTVNTIFGDIEESFSLTEGGAV